METHLLASIAAVAGLLAGAAIGAAFGTLQQAALRRNEEREQNAALKSGWNLMPAAGARVAYLLLTLAAVQFICPFLFADGTKWWVSVGVVAGYGAMLYRGLRRKIAQQPAV